MDGVVRNLRINDRLTIQWIERRPAEPADKVQNYGLRVLELGVHYMALLNLFQYPDGDRGISLLKLTALYFRAHKTSSKYSYEVIRHLVHQLFTMSEQQAQQEFYGHFVNTQGKPGYCIPADLQMEYIVRKIKKNIKHMYAGQSTHNINTRTQAIAGIEAIGNNFDDQADVVIRADKHSHRDSTLEDFDMIQDLLDVRPFQREPGRVYRHFPNMEKSILERLNHTVKSTADWLKAKIETFATEISQ